jgi:hypothetical protein
VITALERLTVGVSEHQISEAMLVFQGERSCLGSWAGHWAACHVAHSSGTSVTLLTMLQ